MNVPVDPSAGFEGGVVPREEPCADGWREEEDDVVGNEGDKHLVDMQGEGVEVVFLGPGGDEVLEGTVGGEGVAHCCIVGVEVSVEVGVGYEGYKCYGIVSLSVIMFLSVKLLSQRLKIQSIPRESLRHRSWVRKSHIPGRIIPSRSKKKVYRPTQSTQPERATL